MTVRLNPQLITDDMMYESSSWGELEQAIGSMYGDKDRTADQLWNNIRQAAKSNKVLQDALERVILIYHLTEDNDGKTT
jgi:hypothetical protein